VSLAILSLAVRHEHDVVAARQRARQIAHLLDFDVQDQTRIATAVSEIARNAFTYAGGGKVDFLVEGKTSPSCSWYGSPTAGPASPTSTACSMVNTARPRAWDSGSRAPVG
jgi:hypothetical protein